MMMTVTTVGSIHYVGGLTIRSAKSVTTYARGFPCCCSGDRAIRIREKGSWTHDRREVTCKGCLRTLERGDAWNEAILIPASPMRNP